MRQQTRKHRRSAGSQHQNANFGPIQMQDFYDHTRHPAPGTSKAKKAGHKFGHYFWPALLVAIFIFLLLW